jgi:glutamate/tyrosine decarboxylase-like PLP-dependent enzyme
MIRQLGRAGITTLVQEHCRLAARFAERLVREPGVYVLNDVVLNQAIVRFGKPEADETADRLTGRRSCVSESTALASRAAHADAIAG